MEGSPVGSAAELASPIIAVVRSCRPVAVPLTRAVASSGGASRALVPVAARCVATGGELPITLPGGAVLGYSPRRGPVITRSAVIPARVSAAPPATESLVERTVSPDIGFITTSWEGEIVLDPSGLGGAVIPGPIRATVGTVSSDRPVTLPGEAAGFTPANGSAPGALALAASGGCEIARPIVVESVVAGSIAARPLIAISIVTIPVIAVTGGAVVGRALLPGPVVARLVMAGGA